MARALSVEPFQANRIRLPTMPLKPCGTTSTGRPESNSAVSKTLSGILGSAPGLRHDDQVVGPADGADRGRAAVVGRAPFGSEPGGALLEGLLHRGDALAFLGVLGQAAADRRAHAGIGPGHAHDAIGGRLEPDQPGVEVRASFAARSNADGSSAVQAIVRIDFMTCLSLF